MKRKLNSGISQLELMISLIIMGMIAVLLANALNFNRQSLERSQFLANDTEMLVTQHSLRSWMEDMPLDYSGETATAYFEGDRKTLRFRALASDGTFRNGDVAEFTVVVLPDGQDRSLIVRGVGRHPSKDNPYELKRILAADVSKLVIRYYGRISAEPEKQWHDAWSDPTYLPDLVKIEWETGEGSPAPPLTIQPAKVERQRVMSLSSLVPPG